MEIFNGMADHIGLMFLTKIIMISLNKNIDNFDIFFCMACIIQPSSFSPKVALRFLGAKAPVGLTLVINLLIN